jgi:hypothetical protein
MELTFEQIKAITEKYGPTLEQLDRFIEVNYTAGSNVYFGYVRELKEAVADLFVKEIKELQGLPSDAQNAPAVNRE